MLINLVDYCKVIPEVCENPYLMLLALLVPAYAAGAVHTKETKLIIRGTVVKLKGKPEP